MLSAPPPKLVSLFWELLGSLGGGALVEEAGLCGMDLGVDYLLLHPDSVFAFYLLRAVLHGTHRQPCCSVLVHTAKTPQAELSRTVS